MKIFLFYTDELYFIKKYLFWIIFLICLVLHNIFFSFILFNQFNMYIHFYYILFILINKFNRHKRVNILFCGINILTYPHLSIFVVFLLVIVNDCFLFIYINDYRFIILDACISFLIYTLNFLLCKKIHIKIAYILKFFLKKLWFTVKCGSDS